MEKRLTKRMKQINCFVVLFDETQVRQQDFEKKLILTFIAVIVYIYSLSSAP